MRFIVFSALGGSAIADLLTFGDSLSRNMLDSRDDVAENADYEEVCLHLTSLVRSLGLKCWHFNAMVNVLTLSLDHNYR